MPYYEYYSFSYFFLILLLFFLIILILFPNYTKKDIVPPLSDANYTIVSSGIGRFVTSNTNASTFRDLTIQDGQCIRYRVQLNLEDTGTRQKLLFLIFPTHSESHKRINRIF